MARLALRRRPWADMPRDGGHVTYLRRRAPHPLSHEQAVCSTHPDEKGCRNNIGAAAFGDYFLVAFRGFAPWCHAGCARGRSLVLADSEACSLTCSSMCNTASPSVSKAEARAKRSLAPEPTRADWPSALMRRARAGQREARCGRERNSSCAAN